MENHLKPEEIDEIEAQIALRWRLFGPRIERRKERWKRIKRNGGAGRTAERRKPKWQKEKAPSCPLRPQERSRRASAVEQAKTRYT